LSLAEIERRIVLLLELLRDDAVSDAERSTIAAELRSLDHLRRFENPDRTDDSA
jgi:hypothetical protein